MALCGINFNSLLIINRNLSNKRSIHSYLIGGSKSKRCGTKCCSMSKADVSKDDVGSSVVVELGGGPVTKFDMSDFVISDCVSIGLGGRGDEVVFEAMVKNSNSPLYNKRVVLRKFTSSQAQRRGRRAIEVLKKLACRRLLYLSYSMQVHGYIAPSKSNDIYSLTLVHGYHGSYSLRHWLQLSDWLPILEGTLALDEERARKVGDDTVGGPAISRKLRLIRIVMRDLLIGVNYLHSQGLAHTELRLENVHISPLDRHVKVGILGNAADFYESSPNNVTLEGNIERRQMMIAFDMRCVGFMMAKMVLRELMDPLIFMKFKAFLNKGNDPSCLREFLLPIICTNSPSGNAGLQILDRNWGAGWNLLSLLLATKPHERLSCLEALRHPFLCGPRWRVDPSVDTIRWGLGSTAVRIAEEYIYGRHQNWLKFLPGRWRFLYSTGRHIGLTLRQPSTRALIGDVHLTVMRISDTNTNLKFTSDINFRVMVGPDWPHEKTGIAGKLQVSSLFRLKAGRRLYLAEETDKEKENSHPSNTQDQDVQVGRKSSRNWKRAKPIKKPPTSLPVAKLTSDETEISMRLDDSSLQKEKIAQIVLREVRTQIPSEMFDVSRIVCGTYVDSRLLVLRGVDGSALHFTRSCR
ncbi:hypothetical protein GIB67_042248 [Kingdonia uniflora]|uniref:Protein kinase domain-containing protein n=1 Tax=Kingdonia uniflora TaxID=39325 RepID=A0A7J7LDY0_9MAGN|nr:hypothetical protein GIB67_042248 [Kingdonia uniflora]